MINCCHCLQTIGARPVALSSEHLAAAEAAHIATTCARALPLLPRPLRLFFRLVDCSFCWYQALFVRQNVTFHAKRHYTHLWNRYIEGTLHPRWAPD